MLRSENPVFSDLGEGPVECVAYAGVTETEVQENCTVVL